jgi:phage repressor protein C with HTH and peptisase S24 domain
MTTVRKIDPERGERIKFVRLSVMGMRSQEKFAEALTKAGKTATRGAVGNWELGKEVGLDSLTAICDLAGVDLNWLAYGKGEAPVLAAAGRAKSVIDSFDPDATVVHFAGHGAAAKDIPEIDLVAGLGGGGLAASEVTTQNGITFHQEVVRDHWRLPDWTLNRMNVRPQHVAAFPAQGDSMDPTIGDGDVVFIDTRHRVPSPPGIYALADQWGGVVVKRLEVTSRPGDEVVTVRVSSDNPKHNPSEFTLDEIQIIGRYIGRFTI